MPSTLPPQGFKPTLDAWSKSFDGVAKAYVRAAEKAARGILESGPNFDEGWRLICDDVLAGKVNEVQVERDRYLQLFRTQLAILEECRDMVEGVHRRTGQELEVTSRLKAEADTLGKKLKRLESRWQNAEDLEDLAAESIPLSESKLETLRQKFGYPQAVVDTPFWPC